VNRRYLYFGVNLDAATEIATDALLPGCDRTRLVLDPGPLGAIGDPVAELDRHAGIGGVVVATSSGIAGRRRLRLFKAAQRRGLPLWLHWVGERAVEAVDAERLRSLVRLRWAVIVMERAARPVLQLMDASTRLDAGIRWIYRGRFPIRPHDVAAMLAELDERARSAQPVPLVRPSDSRPEAEAGLYLRTDFWVRIVSGGSYGHTCYVAKELSARSGRFACLLPSPYELLDELGVFQIVMDAPPGDVNEDTMVTASRHYYPIVKTACQLLRPAYIYERLCLGNWTAALVSRELGIPYIVEYNGSEIAMQRGFNNTQPVHTPIYLKGEEFAFQQATAISVVSVHVRDDLMRRGVDARKILVNPNGADLDRYAPPPPEDKRRIRRTLGFTDADCVVGFTGTFGWWHGIDVLSAAIPQICGAVPSVKFMLIGDGTHKAQLDDQVERHGLAARVLRVGSVPQAEGARLLKACDIYVSPHSSHMVDGRFFGSPTKIFEYMALGGGIVASDLEQIGQVLSPALRPDALADANVVVRDERAVLCAPGDVDEFVGAVCTLAQRPDVAAALGRNARCAVAQEYSWQRHVERLRTFVDALPIDRPTSGDNRTRAAQPRTREWFEELERERYSRSPWMQGALEFEAHGGRRILALGSGIGTDFVQFARHGAHVTVVVPECDRSVVSDNFRGRGLAVDFVTPATHLNVDDETFDVVYVDGLGSGDAVDRIADIRRALKAGGRVIAVLPSEDSLEYWWDVVWRRGVSTGDMSRQSLAAIGGEFARPYSTRRARALFDAFRDVRIRQYEVPPAFVPAPLRRLRPLIERFAGSRLVVKAQKSAAANGR
jgi:glycosyltransferase involved in cell wall biosynthesis/SAM-dependent methyltransferase